jgi:hypothetical protein
MLRPITFAILGLALVSATPVFGQSPGNHDRRGSLSDARLDFISQVAADRPAGPPPSPETNLLEGAAPGLGLSGQAYSQEDGSVVVRRGLIGSLPIVQGVSAGLGLFSVTHENQKEPEFRLSWSAKNVGPRDRRVAAVGLNVRF